MSAHVFYKKLYSGVGFFMTPTFWLSLEFCALARPGQSGMNSESVGRQVSSMLDSEFFNRLGLRRAAIQKRRFAKMSRIFEKVKISWKSRDFLKKSRFHEQVEISWTSRDFDEKVWILMKTSRFHEKVEIRWTNRDFMKKSRLDPCACIGEKALRVPRAVNFGWRFTARMQVRILCC